jgi:HlyD family secretion protein
MVARKIILPLIALVGAIFALSIVFWSQKKQPIPPIPFPPPKSPYEHAVYGSGIVEASTENIAIGTPFIEPIVAIYVVEGDKVKAGDPLLKQDTRSLEAQKTTAQNQLAVAEINYQNLKTQFSFYERLTNKNAVSENAYMTTYYSMEQAAKQVEVAKAQLNQVITDIERSTIRAPVDGEILQVNAHVGEIYAPVSYNITQSYFNLQTAQILMGTTSPMQMRIEIDQEDSWRFIKGAKATAFLRGNSNIHFPMHFVRIEPYVLPKQSFTGDAIERLDTRVLQVLYQFDQKDLPIYPGQLLDIFIEAAPLPRG